MRKILCLLPLVLAFAPNCRADLLIYLYSGSETVIGGNIRQTFSLQGELAFDPSTTNGTFVGWAVEGGQKVYWTSGLSNHFVINLAGASNQTYTYLGYVRQTNDTAGNPYVWSFLFQGQNSRLVTGKGKAFEFPAVFSDSEMVLRYIGAAGQMVVFQSQLTYSFSSSRTQTSNNSGQSIDDVVSAQAAALQKDGYKSQGYESDASSSDRERPVGGCDGLSQFFR